MIVFCNLLTGVGSILSGLLSFFIILIFINVILSWISADRNNMIVQIIGSMAEPVCEFACRILEKLFRRNIRYLKGMDWSPIWAALFLTLLQWTVAQSLLDYGLICSAHEKPVTIGL